MKIEAIDISVVIDGRTIINKASISCLPGQMTALVGPSGSGKTTLLHCLGLLQRITKGKLLIDGGDATQFSESSRRKFWHDHASFILQDYGVMDEETAGFNISMKLNALGLGAGGNQKKIREALQVTGLGGRENEKAAHFSGGEKQRLGIARAIYKNSDVIFADEPTASLDEKNRTRIIEMFRERTQKGATVIVATHDDGLASLCDQRFSFAPLFSTDGAH